MHAFDPDLGDDDDMTEESEPINDSVDDDTLHLSYHLIRRRWAEADAIHCSEHSWEGSGVGCHHEEQKQKYAKRKKKNEKKK